MSAQKNHSNNKNHTERKIFHLQVRKLSKILHVRQASRIIEKHSGRVRLLYRKNNQPTASRKTYAQFSRVLYLRPSTRNPQYFYLLNFWKEKIFFPKKIIFYFTTFFYCVLEKAKVYENCVLWFSLCGKIVFEWKSRKCKFPGGQTDEFWISF